MVPLTLANLLVIGNGLFWSIAYVLMIRTGFRDKKIAIPIFAFCLNISWEFIFSFMYPHNSVQRMINLVWFILDILILIQIYKLGEELFWKKIKKSVFRLYFSILLIVCFIIMVLIINMFKDNLGLYMAFTQNLIMSILFVLMIARRRNSKGQSLYIALTKMFGTFCASIFVILKLPENKMLIIFGVLIFVFDIVYTLGVYFVMKNEKLIPFMKI